MGEIVRRPPKLASDLVRNNLVAFFGDSISNNGNIDQMGASEYHSWASLLSGGRLRWAGKYGEGGLGLTHAGNSAGTVLGTHLPALLAASPKPAWCVILIGTNDLGGGLGDLIPAYINLVNILRANGIQPVPCTLTPRFGITVQAQIDLHAFNHWVVRYSALRGWPCVDLYKVTVDPTSVNYFLSGYSGDGTHPTNQGSQAMGQAVVDAVAPILPKWPIPLVTDVNINWGLPNGLFDDYTNGARGDAATNWSFFDQTTCMYSIEAASPAAVGNWQVISKESGTSGSSSRSAAIAASPGDVIAWGCAVDWNTISGGRLSASVTFRTGLLNSSPGVSSGATAKGAITNFDRDVAGMLYQESIAPAETVGVTFDFSVGDGTGVLKIAQVTLRNLTAVGAA